MKKLISLLVVTTLICCFGITAFAANPSITFEGKEIAIGSAEETVTLELKINFESAAQIYAAAFQFVPGNGVTIKAVDFSAIEAQITKSGMTDAAAFYYTFMDDNAAKFDYDFPAGEYVVPVTVAVDATAEATYTIGFEQNNTMIMDSFGSPIATGADFPTATITVKPADQPKTVTILDSDVTAVVDADYSETSWQKGQGAMIKFNTADLANFVGMNWALKLTNGATKYAKVADFSVDSVGAPTVQFFATFVMNESEATKDTYYEIAENGVGAVFTTDRTDVWTAE